MQVASIVYLALPVVLFLAGWTRLPVAAVACLLFVLAMARLAQRSRRDASLPLSAFAGWKQVLVPLIVAAGWVALSGIGGIGYQNWDHHFRNAVFHDLVSYGWPVVYPDGTYLAYYFTYWLPAALVGKVLGWQAANVALFAWSVLGVGLTLYALRDLVQRRGAWVYAVFIAFSGLDLAGLLLMDVMNGRLVLLPLGVHLEWWAETVQFSSFTTQLFWVFNQAVPAWIVTLLLLRERHVGNLLALLCLMLPYAPIPFMGALPLVAWQVFSCWKIGPHRDLGAGMRQFLRQTASLQNLLACAVIVPVFSSFFAINAASGGRFILHGPEDPSGPVRYAVFFLLEFIVFVVLILRRVEKQGQLLVVTAALLVIPFVAVGKGSDFCMRASIPPLVALCVCVIRALGDVRLGRTRRVLLCLALLIGAATPFQEVARCLMAKTHGEPMVADGIGSFARRDVEPAFSDKRDNFVSRDPTGTFYQRYLGRPLPSNDSR